MTLNEVIAALESKGLGGKDFLTGATVIESAVLNEDINGGGGLTVSWRSSDGGVIAAGSTLLGYVMDEPYVPTLNEDGTYQWSPKWSDPACLLAKNYYSKRLTMVRRDSYLSYGRVVAVVETDNDLPSVVAAGSLAIVTNPDTMGGYDGANRLREYHNDTDGEEGNTDYDWYDSDGPLVSEGDVYCDASTGKLWKYLNGAWSEDSGGEEADLYTNVFAGSVRTAVEDFNTLFAEVLPGWTVELCGSSAEREALANTHVVCTFDGATLKGALEELANKTAEAYEPEADASGAVTGAVNLYFVGKKIYLGVSSAFSADAYYNRFILLGGARNMAKRVPAGNAYAAVTQRMHVPEGVYVKKATGEIVAKEAGYTLLDGEEEITVGKGSVIDMRGASGLTGWETDESIAPMTRFLVWDNIYPKLELKVTDVFCRLCYLLDDNAEKIPTSDNPGPEDYKMYAKWYVKLSYMDGTAYRLNPAYIIQDKPLSMLFQSGPLTGREFEVVYFDHDYTAPEKDADDVYDGHTPVTGEIRIVLQSDGDLLLPTLPTTYDNGGLCPQVGNCVTLVNVAIEDDYKRIARMELLRKGWAMAKLISSGKQASWNEERSAPDLITGDRGMMPVLGERIGQEENGYVVTSIETNLMTGEKQYSWGTFKPRGMMSSAIDKIGSLSLSGGEATFKPLVNVVNDGGQVIYVGGGGDTVQSQGDVNNSSTSLNTILQTVLKPGSRGSNAVRMDLDNEADLVAIDSDGKVLFDRTIRTVASVYDGDERATENVHNNMTSAEIAALKIGEHGTVTVSNVVNGRLTVTWEIKKGDVVSALMREIKLRYRQETELSAVFSLGITTNGVIYQLKTSVSDIIFKRNSDNSLTPAYVNVDVGWVKYDGDGSSVHDYSEIIPTDKIADGVFVVARAIDRNGEPIATWSGAQPLGWDWLTGTNTIGDCRKAGNSSFIWKSGETQRNGVLQVPNSTSLWAIEIALSKHPASYYDDGGVRHFVVDSDIIDRETLPIVLDGEHGDDGNGIVSITRLYGRSKNGTSTNDSTAPQNLDTTIGTNGWSVGSPAVTSVYQYLWVQESTVFTDQTKNTEKYYCVGKIGDTGIDGAGSEWVFVRTTEYDAPLLSSDQSGYASDDDLPKAKVSNGRIKGNPLTSGASDEADADTNVLCTDDPKGASAAWPYEWVAKRKKVVVNGVRVWGKYYDGVEDHKMRLWDHFSADGESPWIADLDNEMDAIQVTDGGHPVNAQSVKTIVSLHHGSSQESFTLSGVTRSGTSMTLGTESGGVTVTFNSTTKELTVSYGTGATLTGKEDIAITLSRQTAGGTSESYTVHQTIVPVNGDVYNLLPSVSQLKVAMNGASYGTAESLGCGYRKRDINGGVSTVSNFTGTVNGYHIYYRRRVRSNGSWESTYYDYATASASGRSIKPLDANTYDSVEFIFYKVGTGTAPDTLSTTIGAQNYCDETLIADRETVPVVADGVNGTPAPYYEKVWYAWCSVASTSNVNTSPFTEPYNGWSEGVIPQNDGGLAYLWRRSLRYAFDNNAHDYVPDQNSSNEPNYQYIRMTGTDGTSINVKGTVTTVAGLSSISNPSDGDTYKCVADGHLYMWSSEASDWVDLGQFQGQNGVTYYLHIAWAAVVTINGNGVVTAVEGFVTVKAANDIGHPWMGVYIDTNSGQDPSNKLLYTWSNTRGERGMQGEDGKSREMVFKLGRTDSLPNVPGSGIQVNTRLRGTIDLIVDSAEEAADLAVHGDYVLVRDEEWLYCWDDDYETLDQVNTNDYGDAYLHSGNGHYYVMWRDDTWHDAGTVLPSVIDGCNIDGYVPDDWNGNALPISTLYRFLFACWRDWNSVEKKWSVWKGPMIYSVWGERGTDGDSVQYVFKLFDHELSNDVTVNGVTTYGERTNYKPVKPSSQDANGKWLPAANASGDNTGGSWTDEAESPTALKGYCYCSIIRRVNGVWGSYEKLALWSRFSHDAVYIDLDNEHEDFLYDESGVLIAPKHTDGSNNETVGSTINARLYASGVLVSASDVNWSIDTLASYGVLTDSNDSDFAEKGTSIDSNGVLRVKHLTADSAKVLVKGEYPKASGRYYYGAFTGNKVYRDKYDLVLSPNSIGYTGDDYEPQYIEISANRTDLHGHQTQGLELVTNDYTDGLRVYAKLSSSSQDPVLVTHGYYEVDDNIASTNNSIYFELRLYEGSDYRLCDWETVPITSGTKGLDAPYYVDEYARYDSRAANNATGAPSGNISTAGWSSSAPAVSGNYKYLWKRTSHVLSDGTTETDGSGNVVYSYMCMTPEDGAAGICVRLEPENVIITQSMTKSGADYLLESVGTVDNDTIYGLTKVKIADGDTEVTASSAISVGTLVASGCTAVKFTDNNEVFVGITGVTKSSGHYVSKGSVEIPVTYKGKAYTATLRFWCNLLGDWKETVIGDTKASIATSTLFTLDSNGNIIASDYLGTFIQSSTQSISNIEAKLKDASGNPITGTIGSYLTQTVSGFYFVVKGDLATAGINIDEKTIDFSAWNINFTASAITLSAEKITWNGQDLIPGSNKGTPGYDATEESMFYIDPSGNVTMGNLTARNGSFSGTIYATDGEFSGTLKATLYDVKVVFKENLSTNNIPGDADYYVCGLTQTEIFLPYAGSVAGKKITICNPTKRSSTDAINLYARNVDDSGSGRDSMIILDDYAHQPNNVPMGQMKRLVLWAGPNPTIPGAHQWYILEHDQYA